MTRPDVGQQPWLGRDRSLKASTVLLVVRFDILDFTKWESVAAACTRYVEANEPGTLDYAWYVDEARREGRLVERYASPCALRDHLCGEVFAEIGRDFSKSVRWRALEVFGVPPDELRTMLRSLDLTVWHGPVVSPASTVAEASGRVGVVASTASGRSPKTSAIELVRSLYAAFSNHDGARLREICARNISWQQNPGFPGGAHWHGVEQVIQHVLEGNASRWQEFRFQSERIAAVGSTVYVEGTYDALSRAGVKVRAEAVHVYEVRDGEITSFRQYADSKLLWDALQVLQG